jgi:hypothetical protein
MNRGRAGEGRGGKEMDGYPLTQGTIKNWTPDIHILCSIFWNMIFWGFKYP